MNTLENLSTEQIRAALATQAAVVTFTKKSGEQRIMTCTLVASAIPFASRAISENMKEPHPTNVTVWDLNANAWRCFSVDRVQAIEWENELTN